MTENDNICVLRTGKLHEHDLASITLKEKEIPHFSRSENSAGLSLAMPIMPSMGPGSYYSIFVPREFADNAVEILKELPIELTTGPENWHFAKDGKPVPIIKIYLWICLIILFISFISFVIDIF